MADMNLTQAEAVALIAMEKYCIDDDRIDFPLGGRAISVQLQSADKREQFVLDLSRGRIDLLRSKCKTGRAKPWFSFDSISAARRSGIRMVRTASDTCTVKVMATSGLFPFRETGFR
jgi:hypothetical protein